jgi:hypothetical protein
LVLKNYFDIFHLVDPGPDADGVQPKEGDPGSATLLSEL